MTAPAAVPLTARRVDASLAGSLWRPADAPRALLLMHPGSGPSDRHNDVFFPPIRRALLDAGIAVASFDKRGVGGSGGDWLEAGIEEQAEDLLAGLAAATALVPDVPRGVFGHSQGGWVVLEATRRAAPGELDFAVTSAGPAVPTGEQERYAAARAIERSDLDAAARAVAAEAADALFTLVERGAPHAELLQLIEAHGAALAPVLGDDVPDERLWRHFTRLAAFDPLPAMRALRVPLLACFGADDTVTPTTRSIEVLHESVDSAMLRVAVLPGGGHRMAPAGETAFVDGYPDVVVDFVRARARRTHRT